MAVSDGYQYKELPLPDYSAGIKGLTRSLSSVSGGESAPNLGDSWKGGNDNVGGGEGTPQTVDLELCDGVFVRVYGYVLEP
jgi:hypothetical protein